MGLMTEKGTGGEGWVGEKCRVAGGKAVEEEGYILFSQCFSRRKMGKYCAN